VAASKGSEHGKSLGLIVPSIPKLILVMRESSLAQKSAERKLI